MTSGGDVALPAGVRSVVVDLDGAVVDSPITTSAAPEDVAYVLYTSGSTGVPKGVAVTHANAVHYVRAVSRVLADVPRDAAGNGLAALDGLHFGLAGTLAADLGYTSLLAALAAGGTLHVLSAAEATEPARFAERVTAQKLDVLKITPGHLHALAGGRAGHELAALLPARWLVVGGEALRPALARTLLGAGTCRLLNHYGPTETTIGACTFEVTRASLDAAVAQGAQSVPIGAPLANMQAVVVDARGTEQPVGVPGELVLGGAGVAAGYLGRAELTAERFGRRGDLRTYRSGDIVRRLPDGTIEFLGRADDQVKVRGYRVELGEIETVLAAHPGVQRAVVLARGPATSANGASEAVEATLVAYVVPKEGGYAVSHTDRPTEERLRAWASTSLPAYMVPSAIVLLDALPLTANGKVDRAALPSPASDAGVSTDTHVLPRTPTEEQLCALWSEVLKKERIGVTDSFLALGGHSLLAIRILGRISKTFGVRLPLRTLFERPTVEAIASAIDVARGGVVTGAGTAATVSQDGPQ